MSKKKEATLNEVSDLVRHVAKHMATKEDLTREISPVRKDVAGIRTDIVEIRTELAGIRRYLDSLEEIVSDHSHYTKEIDHALARIAAIEKRLGIEAN